MFAYYENEKIERFTMRKVYRMFCVMVDDIQKSEGTDFNTWLSEMEHMQILNRI